MGSETIGFCRNVHGFVIVLVHVLDGNVLNSLEMGISNRRDGRESRVLWDAVSFTSTSTSHEYDHETPLPIFLVEVDILSFYFNVEK